MIVSTSAHRKEAIDASAYAIEEVKRLVPIWKKEIYEDGDTGWKQNTTSIHLTDSKEEKSK